LDARSTLLLLLHHEVLLLREARAHGLLSIGRYHLGSGGINKVLASHGVVVELLSLSLHLSLSVGLDLSLRLGLSEAGLKAELVLHVTKVLLLLFVDSHLLLSKVRVAEVELLKLLRSCLNIPKLLLEALLLLGKVHVGGNKLGVQVGVHLLLSLIVERQLGRSQNLVNSVLLVHHVLVLVLLDSILGESGLGGAVVHGLLGKATVGVAVGVGSGELLRTSRCGRGRTKASSSGRLGSCPEASKEMRSAGTRGGNARVVCVVALLNGIEGEGLDSLAATALGKATSRHGQTVGGSEVGGGSHLEQDRQCLRGSEMGLWFV